MPTVSEPTADRLYHPLDALRGTIRRFVVWDGLLAAGLFLVAWFWLGLVADFGLFKLTGFDWVQDAPRAVRGAVLLGLLAALAAIVVRRVALRLTREFSYPALALVLEKRFPAVLGDKLITAVEMADVNAMAKYGYSADMIRETVAEAREAVGKVPVNAVFNWHRLRAKAVLLVAAAVGALALAYATFAATTGSTAPGEFTWRFGDVAAIWGERNLLLQNVPWPRRAYLELVEFPGNELRIGKDAAAPKVRVRAYQWVIADDTTRDGWRPMRESDLYALGVENVNQPKFPIFSGVEPTVDQMESLAKQTNLWPSGFAELEELAAKPSMSRTLRKLDIPTEVTLSYRGEKTSGTVSLTREASGEFSGEVTGLKESVRFVVRGEDFSTAPKRITLVPPPMFTRLARTEYQPAYLYHPAPAGGSFADLKGLRQVFPDKELSLTGDKSVCTVPAGTELEFAGTADKPLKAVMLTPKAGKLPGDGKPLSLPVAGDSFTLALRGEYRIVQPVEFDLTLVDEDDVKTTRGVLVQVTEDNGPQVELAVDTLRRVGNAYLCTPMAFIPFLSESIVRDDTGLSRVEYEFTATKQAADVVVGLQAQAVAGVWAAAPVVPNLGSAVGPAVSTVLATALSKGEKKVTGQTPVYRFVEDYAALPKDTLAALKAKLTGPIDADRPNVVRQIKFQDPVADAFDLERALPDIRVADPGEIQPRYRVELTVTATDVNCESGPKRGQNLEPIRLLVVSEQDLLAEVSKDEENLISKLDDAIRKLYQARAKFHEAADSLLSPVPPENALVAGAVRALDVIQDAAKSRDTTQGVLTDYRRLRREVEVNRCNRSVGEGYESGVIRPLDAILQADFPAAEQVLEAFQAALQERRRPDDGTTAAARLALAELIAKLEAVRLGRGEAVNINKVREQLRQIIVRQQTLAQALDTLKRDLTEKLFAPAIQPVPPVVLARGETKAIRHAVDWNVYEGGEFTVKLELPLGGALTGPASVAVKDDRNDFEYDLTAGDAPGDYTVRLVPSVGKAVEVKVTVR